MTDKYYYDKTEQYEKISNRDILGCFQVSNYTITHNILNYTLAYVF